MMRGILAWFDQERPELAGSARSRVDVEAQLQSLWDEAEEQDRAAVAVEEVLEGRT